MSDKLRGGDKIKKVDLPPVTVADRLIWTPEYTHPKLEFVIPHKTFSNAGI